MLPVLVFLLSFGQFYAIVDSNTFADNEIDENSFKYADAEFPYRNSKALNVENLLFFKQLDNFPLFKLDPEKTLVKFQRPFTSVNIDFEKNAVLSKFRKDDELFEHSGKRQFENTPEKYTEDEGDDQRRNERSTSGARDPRGDNFMRFGRSPHEDFMRFGRAPQGMEDFMRFGRDHGADYFRLGRSLRVRRDPGSDFMRLGRGSPVHERMDKDIADNFMRFGRSVTWPNDGSTKHDNNQIEKSLKLPKNDLDRILINEPTNSLKTKSTNAENISRRDTGNA